MPRPRKSNLSQKSRNAIRLRKIANQSNEEEREIAREKRRLSMARLRSSQTLEIREAARNTARMAMRNRRANHRYKRDNFRRAKRNATSVDLSSAALPYNCTIEHSSHPSGLIGPMVVVYENCDEIKFSEETPGLSCLNDKVKLSPLTPPPEPLHSLLRGVTPESRSFLANTQKYNDFFQMTSFGADIEEHDVKPTFQEIYIEES